VPKRNRLSRPMKSLWPVATTAISPSGRIVNTRGARASCEVRRLVRITRRARFRPRGKSRLLRSGVAHSVRMAGHTRSPASRSHHGGWCLRLCGSSHSALEQGGPHGAHSITHTTLTLLWRSTRLMQPGGDRADIAADSTEVQLRQRSRGTAQRHTLLDQ
jgi:hypothetical protein